MITVKKYPNRRLYDTSQSQYINLEDIKRMINQSQEFEVLDSKTGADVTKSLLLQIISEQEATDQQSLLTNTLLKQLIRFYDSDQQAFLRHYLEQSLVHFIEQKGTVETVMKQMVESGPMGIFTKMMEQNMQFWAGDKNKK